MSTYKITYVICDRDGCEEEADVTGTSAEDARLGARTKGWTTVRGGTQPKDYCPQHSREED